MPFSSLFVQCENRYGSDETKFNLCDNRTDHSEYRIGHYKIRCDKSVIRIDSEEK